MKSDVDVPKVYVSIQMPHSSSLHVMSFRSDKITVIKLLIVVVLMIVIVLRVRSRSCNHKQVGIV